MCWTELIKLVSAEATILKAQLLLAEHVIQMASCRLPRQILNDELAKGAHSQGCPRKRFKDTTKESLKHCGFPACESEVHSIDRTDWWKTIKAAFVEFESNRLEHVVKARGKRKTAAVNPVVTPFQCSLFLEICASRIGLYSHRRTRNRHSQ